MLLERFWGSFSSRNSCVSGLREIRLFLSSRSWNDPYLNDWALLGINCCLFFPRVKMAHTSILTSGWQKEDAASVLVSGVWFGVGGAVQAVSGEAWPFPPCSLCGSGWLQKLSSAGCSICGFFVLARRQEYFTAFCRGSNQVWRVLHAGWFHWLFEAARDFLRTWKIERTFRNEPPEGSRYKIEVTMGCTGHSPSSTLLVKVLGQWSSVV